MALALRSAQRTLKKAARRTGLGLQKEAITWKLGTPWKGHPDGALCGWAELGKTCESRQTTARVSHREWVPHNSLRGWLKNERQTQSGQDAKS